MGLITGYLFDGKKEDVYDYGFWDYVRDSFKGPLKEKLLTFVLSVIVGLVVFFILGLLARQCNFDDEDDDWDDERGLRLHTELLMDYKNAAEDKLDTIYCGSLFDYWAI